MELRKSRWTSEDDEKLDEHRHGHYNWHLVDTKHRPMRLDLVYPEVNMIMRSRSFLSLKAFAPHLIDKLIKNHGVDKIGATVSKRGGPVEIYLDKLLEDTTHLALSNWGCDVLDDTKHDDDSNDLISILVILFCHSSYYIHEILHRMWRWEGSYKQNRKRSMVKEEKIVMIISYAVNTYLHNHLFKPSPDESWEIYKVMLKEVK